jgi:hypothetical protein
MRRGFGFGLTLLVLAFGLMVWRVTRVPAEPPRSSLVVNDVSQLNPIRVSKVVAPTTTKEIATAVGDHAGPISIGGARHSMGGQIATDGALHIDMRGFNEILEFSPASKTITVQGGATWREIQEVIDPADLSIRIMQSYANFTVGGSLSVNGHGRSVGLGPLIYAVKSFKLVLADGSLVEATPTAEAEIFFGAIGGYGALGVITEATLELTDNVRVKRHADVLPITAYKQYFFDYVRYLCAEAIHSRTHRKGSPSRPEQSVYWLRPPRESGPPFHDHDESVRAARCGHCRYSRRRCVRRARGPRRTPRR